MLAPSGFPLCSNTYEREKLGWINPTQITGDILNAPMNDYVTSGAAYEYHPSNGSTYENFYFENHQKLNIYDDVTTNPNDKGIFVLHQGGYYNSQTDIMRVETSNGRWNWSNPSSQNCFGNPFASPSFKMTSVNRAAYNNRDKIPKSGGGSENLYSYIDNEGHANLRGLFKWLWNE